MSTQRAEMIAYMSDWTKTIAQSFNKDVTEIESILAEKLDKQLMELGNIGVIIGTDVTHEDFAQMIQSEVLSDMKTEAAVTKADFRVFLIGKYAKNKSKNTGKESMNAIAWVISETDPNRAIRKAKIAAFEEHVPKLESLVGLETYVAKLQYRKEELDISGGDLNLTIHKETEFIPAEFDNIPAGDIKKKRDIILKNYIHTDLAHAVANKSRNQKDSKYTDSTDLRVIKVNIKDVSITANKDGSDFAKYGVIDGTYMKSKFINFSVIATPEIIESAGCGEGSLVSMLGTIEVSATNGEPSMRAVAVFPIIPKPLNEEYRSKMATPNAPAQSGGIQLD